MISIANILKFKLLIFEGLELGEEPKKGRCVEVGEVFIFRGSCALMGDSISSFWFNINSGIKLHAIYKDTVFERLGLANVSELEWVPRAEPSDCVSHSLVGLC